MALFPDHPYLPIALIGYSFSAKQRNLKDRTQKQNIGMMELFSNYEIEA